MEHQVSLCASDTIAAKRRFGHLLYDCGVTVCSYRAENCIFNAIKLEEEIKKEAQGITFGGVDAQHQNGLAERAVIERARTSLIHAAIQNPDNVDATLWLFAFSHSCYVWNELPKKALSRPHKF